MFKIYLPNEKLICQVSLQQTYKDQLKRVGYPKIIFIQL